MDAMLYIAVGALAAVTLACIYFLAQQNKKHRQLVKENNTLRKELEELNNEVNALQVENSRFILNPHLFKNTLNSIQGYAFRTHQALEKLGGVLDYILYDSNKQLISLKSELEFAHNFIELNKIKLNPVFDIRVKENVNENNALFEQSLVAPMITAYFIENAFKHADLQSADAFISIEMVLDHDDFRFTVSNKVNKNPPFKGKGGLGQDNLKKRLDLIYKNYYQLDYVKEGGVYNSVLKINLREFKNKMPDIG